MTVQDNNGTNGDHALEVDSPARVLVNHTIKVMDTCVFAIYNMRLVLNGGVHLNSGR